MKIIFLKFFLLTLCFLLISEIANYYLNIDNLLINSFSEKFTTEQLNSFSNFQKKWKLISAFFLPLSLFVKTFLISSVIYIGIFFYYKSNLTLKPIWLIVIKAEFIFLIVGIIKIIWFYFFKSNYTLEDVQYFYPLSALNIIEYEKLEIWLVYPLQTLNLFEVAYIIYLSYQIGYLTKTNADNGLKIVGYSYVPALLLWVTVVMFFTLNYS